MDTNSAVVRRAVEQMPVASLLGLEIDVIDPERAVISMPLVRALTFDGQTCQGGVVATLADFAAVSAAAAAARPGQAVATTGGQFHNLAPARGDRLVAVGRLVGRPGRTMVAAADVYVDDESGVHCLTGLFTTAIVG